MTAGNSVEDLGAGVRSSTGRQVLSHEESDFGLYAAHSPGLTGDAVATHAQADHGHRGVKRSRFRGGCPDFPAAGLAQCLEHNVLNVIRLFKGLRPQVEGEVVDRLDGSPGFDQHFRCLAKPIFVATLQVYGLRVIHSSPGAVLFVYGSCSRADSRGQCASRGVTYRKRGILLDAWADGIAPKDCSLYAHKNFARYSLVRNYAPEHLSESP